VSLLTSRETEVRCTPEGKSCTNGWFDGYYYMKDERDYEDWFRRRRGDGVVKGRSGDLTSSLQGLINLGTIGGLTDEQLLDQFANRRDGGAELAFEVLLRRHGSMVLRVCRSVLGDCHDADDAFQATFLVLVRQAQSIRKHASLGSWLYGVARRVSLKSKRAGARRRRHEGRHAETTPESASDREHDDLELIVLEEVGRLPEKYRAPIVLCYLEGMTHEAAARQLGWPSGTVQGRLARARELLRTRLSRRGLALPGALAAEALFSKSARAMVAPSLLDTTIKLMAARAPAGAAVLLARTVLRSSSIVLSVQGAIALTAVFIVGAGIFTLVRPERGDPAQRRPPGGPRIVTPASPKPSFTAPDEMLPPGAVARLGPIRFWHGHTIQQVAYTADGQALVSIGDDGVGRFWDAGTGRERGQLRGRDSRIRSVLFAPDDRAVVWEESGTIRLLERETMREIRQFKATAPPRLVCLSANGRVLAAVGSSGLSIALWDVNTGRVLRAVEGHRTITTSLALSPDGALLVSSGKDSPESNRFGRLTEEGDGSLRIWDVTTGTLRRRVQFDKMWADSIVFAPAGTAFAAAMTDGWIRLWDVVSDKEPRILKSKGSAIGCAAFAPGGSTLAWSHALLPAPRIQESAIHLIDVASGRELWKHETPGVVPYSLVFAPDGRSLASSGENVIRLWDVATGEEMCPNLGDRNRVGGIAVTPDGRTVITGGQDGTIRFRDLKTGDEKRRIERPTEPVRFLTLSADGKTLVSGGEFHPTRFWNVETGTELRQFQLPGTDHAGFFGDLSADGKTMATAFEGNEVIFVDAGTGKSMSGQALAGPRLERLSALCFAPDGRSVASISGDWLRFWNVATALETRRFKLPNASNLPVDHMNMIGARVVFSPDGKVLAASSQRDGTIFLLDANSGTELVHLDGSEDLIKSLAFSPDGVILATQFSRGGARRDGAPMIRLWDIAGRREICRFDAHRNAITALMFTPDGTRLLSASEDSTVLIWNVSALTGRAKAGPPPTRFSAFRPN
jgi:RNA polymerase sigma factor (sigma-70 family)